VFVVLVGANARVVVGLVSCRQLLVIGYYMIGKRDPSSHRTPEQIQKMDSGYNATPTNIKKRSERNEARSLVSKKVGKAAVAGKDIDHIKPVRSGGTNAPGNLRVRSRHANRGWEK
jgi:hypothetical protein